MSIEEQIDEIESLAWDIRNDFSDPRYEARKIVEICESIREDFKKESHRKL